MSTSVSTRRNSWANRVKSKVKISGISMFPALTMSDEDAFQIELPPSVTERALEELEEKYEDLLASVEVDKLNPKYLGRYIARAEKRRGGPFSTIEKEHFREMAKSQDPEVKRLLALELRVGVPKKVEMEALAAMGKLLLHHEDDQALTQFIDAPDKDPNLREWVRTTLMVNRVEHWMGRYRAFKDWLTEIIDFSEITPFKAEDKESKHKR